MADVTLNTALGELLPTQNSTANVNMSDVIGQKTDTGEGDSLYAKIVEIERHLHSHRRWFGAATSPSGETHVADRIGDTQSAFVADAGNSTWGSWLQILGSSDTPAVAGQAKFDLDYIQVTGNERAGAYFVQISFGNTAGEGLAADDFTEQVIAFDGANNETAFNVHTRRHAAGTKAWIRILCPGQNTGTLTFFLGLHEYE